MPIPLKPFKYGCPKCNYSRVVKIKSDCLGPLDMMAMNNICPKCSTKMEKKNLNFFDSLFS